MTAGETRTALSDPRLPWLLGLGGLATAAAATLISGGVPAGAWLLAFVVLAGFVAGNLGLLMIGHLMSEEWLQPVRSEAEAAVLTSPLLLPLALPLAWALGDVYPWAAGPLPGMPPARAHYLSEPFFLARGALYLALWTALGLWIAHTRRPRLASGIGLALLAPSFVLAANDWVLSLDPLWWSGLFGFAFAASQLLAALAAGILISLLRPEHPGRTRMMSLERALLTLALLTLWMWYVHWLVVWFANLPNEVSWFLARSGDRLWMLLGVALPALVLAVVLLAPPGFGRGVMITGSALLLVQHAGLMLWLVPPPASLAGALVVAGLVTAWAALFAALLGARPGFAAERGRPETPA